MLDWGQRISEIRKDQRLLEDFIILHEAFVIKSASRTCRHFVSKSDDEWSIALLAFSEAIEKYDPAKGSFYGFASMTIRSRLIDWFRANGRQSADAHIEDMKLEKEIPDYNDDLRLEIHALGESLGKYGISFMDMASNSPKAEKTKRTCGEILRYIRGNQEIILDIKKTGSLPLKNIEKNLGLPRKTIERHRKYIIAAVEILTGDYPYLSEYLRYVREEEGS